MVSPLAILHKHLGESESKKDANYAFLCPFCHHPRKNFEINIETGQWHCWVCDKKGGTLNGLLRKVGVTVTYSFSVKSRKKGDKREEQLFLPQEYEPLLHSPLNWETKAAVIYLQNREITPQDILKYKIGYCSYGTYRNCIIIPSYDRDGILNYFVPKNFRTGAYINPPFSKNQIIFDLFINWSQPIVLVEGVFDAFAVQRNCVPLLGKFLPKKLKKAILESPNKDYYVCLDGGEQEIKDAQEIINFLLSVGKNVFHVKLPPEKDPSKLGKENIWNYIYTAKRIEDNFLAKLNW